jgi:hypothetical protein
MAFMVPFKVAAVGALLTAMTCNAQIQTRPLSHNGYRPARPIPHPAACLCLEALQAPNNLLRRSSAGPPGELKSQVPILYIHGEVDEQFTAMFR